MKRLIPLLLLVLALFLGWHLLHPRLPSTDRPICFWSNQTGDDLRSVLHESLSSAKASAFISIYTFTDKRLIKALQTVPQVRLHADKTCNLGPLFPQIKYDDRSGLMHRKIAVIDDRLCLVGSANFTRESLQLHDNLIVGFDSPELALALQEERAGRFHLHDQEIELFFLPRDKAALDRLLGLIQGAQKSLKVAMFHFTHPQLLKAVLGAKVHKEVALDRASKKAIQLFKKAHIPVYTNKTTTLHHKFALIDDETLAFGSANWTRNGLQRNREIVVILTPLTEQQKSFFADLWSQLACPAKAI